MFRGEPVNSLVTATSRSTLVTPPQGSLKPGAAAMLWWNLQVEYRHKG